jgi:hypothetical protein
VDLQGETEVKYCTQVGNKMSGGWKINAKACAFKRNQTPTAVQNVEKSTLRIKFSESTAYKCQLYYSRVLEFGVVLRGSLLLTLK